MRTFVLASGNMHKKQEYDNLIKGVNIEIYPSFSAIENGLSYKENARIKLEALKKVIVNDNKKYEKGTVLFADDSGLEIFSHREILGLYTSRFLEEENATQSEKNQRVISIMKDEKNRDARFVCHISFEIIGDGKIYDAEGEIRGEIAHSILGNDGFGYDPIFIPKGETKTLSALGNAFKMAHSHRYNAVCNMLEILNAMNT